MTGFLPVVPDGPLSSPPLLLSGAGPQMFPVTQTAASSPRRVEVSHLRAGSPHGAWDSRLICPGEPWSLKGAAPLRLEPHRGRIDTGANSQPRGLGKNTSSCRPGTRPGPRREGLTGRCPAGDAHSNYENCQQRQS